jgi:hypothetical protein
MATKTRSKPRSKKASPNKGAFSRFAEGGTVEVELPDEPEPDPAPHIKVDAETGMVRIDNDDGSITIDPTGATLQQPIDGTPGKFNENLALKIDPLERSRIAEDIIQGVMSDRQDRSVWETSRAKCVEMVGLKLEDPKADVSRSAMGVSTSVVRDPTLLTAVEFFRANAYAELCPSAGPVKVEDSAEQQSEETGALAQALQDDLNNYFTTQASEYYPDTYHMLWWTGLTSGTFKKVYKCPLRNRPVSEYVDGTALLCPTNATDLKNAHRVTHEVRLGKDTMVAMQLSGVYRNIPLTEPIQPTISPVEQKKANIEGKAAVPQRIEDQDYTIFECYIKLNIRGFEHKKGGKPTGLPLPYRVTVEETSREILEIRRNWDPDDDDKIYRPANIPFVLFPYSTGLSRIYGSGLGHMMGNMASALTALLRISIDNGMFSNYPGLLKAKGTGRQLQNEIVVPPGGIADIDTGGLPIQQVVMPMPFKDVSQNVVALIEALRAVAAKLGGNADVPVGEGKQDAPVGTTLALIEQSTKPASATHKMLWAAQSEEFRLICKLFRDDPEALWRGNKKPAFGNAKDDAARAARTQRFREALESCDVKPMADPNVPSEMHRKLLAMGLKQLTMGNPAYDQVQIDRYICKTVYKMSDAQFTKFLAPPQNAPPDPLLLKVQVDKQNADTNQMKVQLDDKHREAERQSKENIAAQQIAAKAHGDLMKGAQGQEQSTTDPAQMMALQLKAQDQHIKGQQLSFNNYNAHMDRESKATLKAMDIGARLATHPESQPIVNSELGHLSEYMTPPNKGGGGMGAPIGTAAGGKVGKGEEPEKTDDQDTAELVARIVNALQAEEPQYIP